MRAIPVEDKWAHLECDVCPRKARRRTPRDPAGQVFVFLCEEHATSGPAAISAGTRRKYGMTEKAESDLLERLNDYIARTS